MFPWMRVVILASAVLSLAAGSNQREAEPPIGGAPNRQVLNSSTRPAPVLAPIRIKLPFPEGHRYEIYQGNDGTFSHTGLNRYAYDFGMPENMPVAAAAQGRIVRIKQDSDIGGTSPDHYGYANSVIIDHGDGVFTQYLHLKKNSVKVMEGDVVQGGHVIALSGNTGYSSTPHLHFQVQDATGQSLPCSFLDVPGDGVPRQGRVYASGNDGTGVSHYKGESRLPLDAFTRNRIHLTSTDMPAHLVRADKTYRIEGFVGGGARRVAIFLMYANGGRALVSFFADVKADGSFESEFSVRELRKRAGVGWSERATQSNAFSLAMTPVESDGTFWSNFSVPITIR
jgi:murein DD-endopeptidase MepM/ murein hydrolase activator NlpD